MGASQTIAIHRNRLEAHVDGEKMCQSGYPCLMTRTKEKSKPQKNLRLRFPLASPSVFLHTRLHLTAAPSRSARSRPSCSPLLRRLGNLREIAHSKL